MFDLYNINVIGTPINILTNSFEAKMAQGSIMQSVGYEGMMSELSQGTSHMNQQSLISKDNKRTRRSQENMTEVKIKKVERLKNQKQFNSKGAGLSQYRGKSGQFDENTPPSADFLCSKTEKMYLEK